MRRPIKVDAVFDGWYKDTQLTKAWDFDKDVVPEEPVTLYAKWKEEIPEPELISPLSSFHM